MILEFGKYLLLVLVIIAHLDIGPVRCDGNDESIESERLWRQFKLEYGKKYRGSSSLESTRRKTFLENVKRIRAHNADPTQSYLQGINPLSDLSLSEFLTAKTGLIHDDSNLMIADPPSGFRKRSANIVSSSFPNKLNYQNTGYVSAVKDQGSCNSGYAFAASGAVEAHTFRLFGRMISPSQQQLVDCFMTELYPNRGCYRGSSLRAFMHMMNGMMNETAYPYTSSEGVCRADSSKFVVATNPYVYNATEKTIVINYTDATQTVINFFSFFLIEDPGNGDKYPTFAEAVIKALNEVGPLSVEVCAYQGFQQYTRGVYFNNTICSGRDRNHDVLLVGYDISNSNPAQRFWIVKNSWGTGWGMSGYMRLRYGAGLIRLPTYPNINTTAFIAATTAGPTTTVRPTTIRPTTTVRPTTTTGPRDQCNN